MPEFIHPLDRYPERETRPFDAREVGLFSTPTAPKEWVVNLNRYKFDEPVSLEVWYYFCKEADVKICFDPDPDDSEVAYYNDGYVLGFWSDDPFGETMCSYLTRLNRFVNFINRGGKAKDSQDSSFLPYCSRR